MANSIANFFKGQDQLGSAVSINHKGSSGYGTILGGILSLFFSVFLAIFVAIQIFAWLFQPSYNQSFTSSFLQKKSTETYTIDIKDFLPSLQIISQDFDTGKVTFNNEDFFEIYWSQKVNKEVQLLETVNCKDLIDSWSDMSQKEKDNIKQEFDQFATLCPNITNF